MKWYGSEGDCAPKDKNLQGKSFPQNEDTGQHGDEAIAARYPRLPWSEGQWLGDVSPTAARRESRCQERQLGFKIEKVLLWRRKK